jgi:predicted DNA-binding ribbon-helix-helix protein
MKSAVIKRSIVIAGHKTSISLEDAFWQGLRQIAQAQGVTVSSIVSEIDKSRRQNNLSSAIRLFVLEWVRARAANIAAQMREAVNGSAPPPERAAEAEAQPIPLPAPSAARNP